MQKWDVWKSLFQLNEQDDLLSKEEGLEEQEVKK